MARDRPGEQREKGNEMTTTMNRSRLARTCGMWSRAPGSPAPCSATASSPGRCTWSAGLAEALTRSGFDITRDDLSLLANGPLGWVHITLLVVTGLMTVAGAVGLRRALRAVRRAALGDRAWWVPTALAWWRLACWSLTR